MPKYDIAILTDDGSINQPQNNASIEDWIAAEAFRKKGYNVIRKSWADPTFDWSEAKAAIFRSTWDYFYRYEEWTAFLDRVSSQTRLINPISLIRWNMDKHYLGDLQKSGVPIPETHYLEVGESKSLAELSSGLGWTDMILKPCFAGTSRHTYRLDQNNIHEHESIFSDLVQQEAFMLQPFLKNVVTEGEISLVVIGGRFSHAVIKKAVSGDFRVQSDFGGSVQLYSPDQKEIDFALMTVAKCDPTPTYARVDIVRDNQNELALIELELVEPELWFRLKPSAADLLADSISI